ncbi:NUDIX domain [Legionella beliardensis]|uniref:NUDIX domain n=1 Tax=Legionella beliardensis TaxID=91822 RepID=A0A378HY54_9GAMM|nr:NUDIX hydrolase [Legionella beliardensis]STX27819.1 NUDIX domain [Legionella beliardensis]
MRAKEEEICRLLDGLAITMFGKRIHNPNGERRKFYDIHPYTKQGTGVSCTISYTDAETGVIYILGGKKRNKIQYDQIGGYTRGQGPENSELQFDKRSDDERDRDEEAIIGNLNAVTISEQEKPSSSSQATQAYTLKQLKDASNEGFLQQQANKLGKKINPLLMKSFLFSSGINYSNDYNAWDTALRETKEETGLNLEHCKPHELYTSDDFGITNEERLHTKVTHYLFHLGRLKEPPAVQAGSDLEIVHWLPLHQVNLEANTLNERPIRQSYLLQTLPRAVKKIRELELAEVTGNVFTKYKNIKEATLANPYTWEAHLNHQRILKKAKDLSAKMQSFLENEANANDSQPGLSL